MTAIALALTWDGARCPVRTLPPKARAFLKAAKSAAPSAKNLPKLFADGAVKEIRICWLPQLKGGPEVLSEPFQTPDGLRINFRATKTIRFGDSLGVIYRKIQSA